MECKSFQDAIALDSAQEALLFHSLARPQDDPGLLQVRFRIRGMVDDEVMAQAWNDALARHEALRMTVQTPDAGKPGLALAAHTSVEVSEDDLFTDDPGKQGAALERMLVRDRAEGLDPGKCPVMRLRCLRLGPEVRQYVWTVHQMFVDPRSASVVLHDVLEFYSARRTGIPADLPELPGLADHADRVRAASSDVAQAFWRDLLITGPRTPVTNALRRNAEVAGPSERFDIAVPKDLALNLNRAAAATGTTPRALIGAAWALCLAALSGRDDVVFCRTATGRTLDLEGLDRMAGCFSRAVPVRARIEPEGTVGDLARGLHAQQRAAVRHQYLPMDRIAEAAVGPARLASFDTLLSVQDHPWDDVVLDLDGGVRLCDIGVEMTSAYPLTLVIGYGAQLRLHCIADASLNPAMVVALVAQVPEVLGRICGNPDGLSARDCMAGIRVTPRARQDPAKLRTEILGDMMAGGAHKARTPTELALARIWQDVLGLGQIDVDRSFASLGGRSFAAVRILQRIEAELGHRITLQDFIRAPSIPDLAAIIDGGDPHAVPKWRTLVPFQPAGSLPPIVFLHGSGSHVAFLGPLAQQLGPDQPIHALQPVGLDGGEPPLGSFEELARVQVDELLQVQPTGPYRLVGHNGGARLALEVSYLLRMKGHEIARFVVLDTPEPRPVAPAREQAVGLLRRGRLDQIVIRSVRRFLARPLRRTWRDRTGELEAETRSLVDEVERACFAADVRYAGRHHPGTITVIRSRERKWKTFAWERFADYVDEIVLPIRHHEMFFDPDVSHLAAALTTVLGGPVPKRTVFVPVEAEEMDYDHA